MAAAYTIFNGISSATLGFIIEQLPDHPRAARDVEEIDIPGRDGKLFYDRETHDLVQLSIKVNTNGHSVAEVYRHYQGAGWLTSSDEPTLRRYVVFAPQAQDERFRLGALATDTFDTVTLQMRALPYCQLVNETPLTFLTGEQTAFDGQGDTFSLPLVKVTGAGDVNLMINGSTYLIDDMISTVPVYIDSESKIAYTLVSGVKAFFGGLSIEEGWARLYPGTDANLINWSGLVSKVEITPTWRWY